MENEMAVAVDLSFRVTDVLLIGGTLVSVALSYSNLKGSILLVLQRLESIEKRQDRIDATIENLRVDVADGRVQDKQIERLEEDATIMRKEISDLREGRGFKERVNGEYARTGKVADV